MTSLLVEQETKKYEKKTKKNILIHHYYNFSETTKYMYIFINTVINYIFQ